MALIAMLAWTMGPTAVSAAPSCLADSNPNLVRNGGFESGSGTHVTDWKVEWSSSADPFVYIERGHAHNGAQDLALGTTKASNDIVQKVRGTSRDNIYTICFWLYSSPNVTGGVTTFDVLWNNVTELNLTNSAQFGYQYFAINVLAQGDDSDYLRFRERNNQGFYYMDDVSVQLCSGCTLAPDADRRAKSTQAERTPLE
jgi:hypothetical protein